MAKLKRCELCMERGTRPAPRAEYEVERGPEPGETEWEHYIVCEDCADDLVEGAQENGVEFFMIGYVPMGSRL